MASRKLNVMMLGNMLKSNLRKTDYLLPKQIYFYLQIENQYLLDKINYKTKQAGLILVDFLNFIGSIKQLGESKISSTH